MERPKYQYQPVASEGVGMGAGNYRLCAVEPPPPKTPELPPGSKVTTGTQSDYRETEAQTLPYSPDFVVPPPNEKQRALNQKYNLKEGEPEVLLLRDMTFARGLPAGMAEARQVEARRERRAFDASLPPLSDAAQLPLRQRMMEERELKEWAQRDAEIQELQDERLRLLETAIMRREAEAEEALTARLESLREGLISEKASAFAAIQKKRVAALRKLTSQRAAGSVPAEPRTFLDRALEKSIKEGLVSKPRLARKDEAALYRTRDKAAPRDIRPFDATAGPGAAAASLTVPLLEVGLKVSLKNKATGPQLSLAEERKAQTHKAHLHHIDALLADSKARMNANRGYGEMWPEPLGALPEQPRAPRPLYPKREVPPPPPPPEPVTAPPPPEPEPEPEPKAAPEPEPVVVEHMAPNQCWSRSWLLCRS